MVKTGQAVKLEGKHRFVVSILLVKRDVEIEPAQSSMFQLVEKRAPNCTVSKNHQTPGAKHWKERQDHADGGRVGGTRRMIFPPLPRLSVSVSSVMPEKRGERHIGFVRQYEDGARVFTPVAR
jgi:hypothetical protein